MGVFVHEAWVGAWEGSVWWFDKIPIDVMRTWINEVSV